MIRTMSSRIHDPAVLRRAVDHAVAFLESLPERPVRAAATRDELMRVVEQPLSDGGEDAAAVIDVLARAGELGAVANAGPRYFGFVIGGSLPVTVGADWLTSAWDQNTGLYVVSPLMSVLEDMAARWLLDLFDLPRTAGVGFTTGCQMANFTCLAAARHAVLRDAGWNVEEQGLQGGPRLNVVVSAQSHVTIHVALRMLGLGSRAAIVVAADEQGRMKPAELQHVLQRLKGPTIVCAQAGDVNSGAIDPLAEIAAIAHQHGAWLHVDGAFGLWARASRTRRDLTAGIERADSWATDAHKWLNVPYDCGVAIVRDAAAHRASMTSSAAYLVSSAGVERDNLDWVPEFSRRGRGATVYAALRHLGRRGVEAMIDRCCDLTRMFAKLLSRDKRVKILNDVVLNQVLVRFGDSDDVTRQVIRRVQEDGTCWLGGTTWQGQAAMRISVCNWATSEEDVERSCAAILRVVPGA
jgi:glutamate/tyrosine decarboxylase-like PLP-dependent enzyme